MPQKNPDPEYSSASPSGADEQSEFITVDDLARILKVSPTSIYRMIKSSGLPGYKVGGAVRLIKQEVFEWISQHKIGRNEEEVTNKTSEM